MNKIIISVSAVLFAALVTWGDTWTDPDTGITWKYTVSNGKSTIIGGGTYNSPAISKLTTGALGHSGNCPQSDFDRFKWSVTG